MVLARGLRSRVGDTVGRFRYNAGRSNPSDDPAECLLSRPGTEGQPLRVALIGSGPAGFYTAQALLKAPDGCRSIDMFERLPTPFGLVRHGVAPDHQKIKSVIAVYDRLARDPRFRFFGNVTFGEQLELGDLRRYYHQIVFATGAQTDRRMGIPGEDLARSHPATEFVAWYNGHPDYADCKFDLSVERAVVVGVGNVAVDVARILCRSPDELARTDIADPALEQLRGSSIREVVMLGRRGPAQAAFTNPEVKELGELSDALAVTQPDEMDLDPLSREQADGDRLTAKKCDILRSFVDPDRESKPKRLVFRFLVSPIELVDDGSGRVGSIRLARNELYAAEDGSVRCRATDRVETLETGLVFRSVGYRGVPLPGLPFDDRRAVVPNTAGRVEDGEGSVLPGLYVSGWIKRGPTGVIGTNKADAVETVGRMLEDATAGRTIEPEAPDPEAVVQRLRSDGVPFVSYEDWTKVDAAEIARGKPQGRPRVKFLTHREFADALAD
jgi:ferredoxin--NADP+ reductase